MADKYTEIKEKSNARKKATYDQRKQRAFSEGVKSLFVTCPLCGRNRPLKDRWGNEADFIVKPDYFLVQARYSVGRGSGFFLKHDESYTVDRVKEEFPEIYKNLKKAIKELHQLFK